MSPTERQIMRYVCGICLDETSTNCKHSALYKKPCYSGRRAGCWKMCEECCWRFVCITGSDLLEAQYEASVAREGLHNER